MKKSKHPFTGIHVQAADKQSIEAAAAQLLLLLSAPCGDQPKVEAMITLRHLCEVKNITISNNHIEVSPEK